MYNCTCRLPTFTHAYIQLDKYAYTPLSHVTRYFFPCVPASPLTQLDSSHPSPPSTPHPPYTPPQDSTAGERARKARADAAGAHRSVVTLLVPTMSPVNSSRAGCGQSLHAHTTDRQTDSQSNRHTDRQAHRQTITQTDRQADNQADRQTVKQTDGKTNEYAIRQTKEQSERWTDRETARQTHSDLGAFRRINDETNE